MKRRNGVKKELIRVGLHKVMEDFVLDIIKDTKDMLDSSYPTGGWFEYKDQMYCRVKGSDILYGAFICLTLIRGGYVKKEEVDFDKIFFFYKYIDDYMEAVMRNYCIDIMYKSKTININRMRKFMVLWIIIVSVLDGDYYLEIPDELANMEKEV